MVKGNISIGARIVFMMLFTIAVGLVSQLLAIGLVAGLTQSASLVSILPGL